MIPQKDLNFVNDYQIRKANEFSQLCINYGNEFLAKYNDIRIPLNGQDDLLGTASNVIIGKGWTVADARTLVTGQKNAFLQLEEPTVQLLRPFDTQYQKKASDGQWKDLLPGDWLQQMIQLVNHEFTKLEEVMVNEHD